MNGLLKSLAVAAAVMVAPVAASAATIYATAVDNYSEGLNVNQAGRDNPANALGAADGAFLSLGLGGSVTLSFGENFVLPGTVIEITNGSRAGYVETADVFGVGLDDGLVFIGSVSNATASITFGNGSEGIFKALKFVDTSTGGSDRDGFDIDSVSVSTVPVPAAGGLLLLGLAGIAALRRRKAA